MHRWSNCWRRNKDPKLQLHDILKRNWDVARVCALLLGLVLPLGVAATPQELVKASAKGDLAEVERLLAAGDAAGARAGDGSLALQAAITSYAPSLGVIELLLAKGAKPDQENAARQLALHLAIAIRKQDVREAVFGKLIEAGADIHLRDRGGYTPLITASEKGCFFCVKLLLAKGADKDARTPLGESSLARALLNQHHKIAEMLLDAGADVSFRSSNLDTDAMMSAAWSGYVDIVRRIHAKGGKIDHANVRGESPLIFASVKGHVEVIEYLLAQGAKVNQRDLKGMTPLLAAALEANPDTLRLLLRHGADLRATDLEGRTVFIRAAINGRVPQLVALREAGADLEARDAQGYSALMAAVEHNRVAAAEWLIAASADVKVRSLKGESAFDIAIAKNNETLASLLIESGASVTERDRDGNPPLLLAVRKGARGIVARLLKAGVKINETNDAGQTAAYEAAAQGRVDMLDVLLRGGADLNLADHKGVTPFARASLDKRAEAAKWLIEKGAR